MRYTAYKCDYCKHDYMGEPPITDYHEQITYTFCSRTCHVQWLASIYNKEEE